MSTACTTPATTTRVGASRTGPVSVRPVVPTPAVRSPPRPPGRRWPRGPLHTRGETPQRHRCDEHRAVPAGEGAEQHRDGQFQGAGDDQGTRPPGLRCRAIAPAITPPLSVHIAVAPEPNARAAASHRKDADQASGHRTGVGGTQPECVGCLSTRVHPTILTRRGPPVAQLPTRGADRCAGRFSSVEKVIVLLRAHIRMSSGARDCAPAWPTNCWRSGCRA